MASITQRKTAKGKIVYDRATRRKGSPTTYKIFSRLTDARYWAQDIESKMRTGAYFLETEAQRHTFSQAIDRYIAEELPKKPNSYRNQKRELIWFKEQAGTKMLSEVTPGLLSEMKGKFLTTPDWHGKIRKPQSWNRYLSAISSAFQMGVADWQRMESNPARKVKREPEAAVLKPRDMW